MNEKVMELAELINKQAEDEALWFIDATITEAYLQQELRKLHAAVEACFPEHFREVRYGKRQDH